MRRRILPLVLAAAWPVLAWGQAADPKTLADIRTDIASLAQQIDGLKGELTASGQLSQGVAGNTPLERLDAIEAELQRLTSKTEELEFRINRITTDGTNRLGDLEFRVCEVEPGCDTSALGDTPSLGGVDNASVVPTPEAPETPPAQGPELAVNEQTDFEKAQAALSSGDAPTAAALFQAFAQAYPGSPLMAQAQLGRGQALDATGDVSNAARAYLDAFSAEPNGPAAADALLGLGRNLGKLGQVPDACTTLREISNRFPSSPLLADAQTEMRSLACP